MKRYKGKCHSSALLVNWEHERNNKTMAIYINIKNQIESLSMDVYASYTIRSAATWSPILRAPSISIIWTSGGGCRNRDAATMRWRIVYLSHTYYNYHISNFPCAVIVNKNGDKYAPIVLYNSYRIIIMCSSYACVCSCNSSGQIIFPNFINHYSLWLLFRAKRNVRGWFCWVCQV